MFFPLNFPLNTGHLLIEFKLDIKFAFQIHFSFFSNFLLILRFSDFFVFLMRLYFQIARRGPKLNFLP